MTIRLDRLQRGVAYFTKDGLPSLQFQLLWQRTVEQIETSLNGFQAALDAAAAADAAAILAQTAAATAQTAADGATVAAGNAQTAADGATTAAMEANANASLIGSYVTGLTLSATDAGTDATISVSAHTREYADSTSVSVSAGTITGLAYSTAYWVYYDQPSRAGGAVTYVATTTEATAAQIGDRHTLGAVTTPASGGGAASGNVVRPPGVSTI